jgi:hypothetical protein
LVHAGKLGSSEITGRSARNLLLGLKAFIDTSAEAAARTKLILVGPKDQATETMIGELGLQENVETVGRVSYEESLGYIASASACVLIEAKMDESIFFPSKLADYIVCRMPVLALSPRVGIAADLANRGELILVDQDDPEAVRNALSALYSKFRSGTLSSMGPSDRLVTEWQGPSVAQEFLSACHDVLSHRRTQAQAAKCRLGKRNRSLSEKSL